MSETKVEIIVSGDNAAQTIEQITAQLPEGTTVSDGTVPTATAPSLDALMEDAVIASGALPGQIGAWWAAMPVSPFTVLVICAALFAGVYVIERLVGAVWIGKDAAPDTDGQPVGTISAAIQWGWRKLALLVMFFVLCRIGISTIAARPDSEGAKLAGVTLGAVMLYRGWYLIGEFLMAPRAPARRPTGLTDDEAGLILRRAVVAFVIVALMSFARGFVEDVTNAGESAVLFALATRVFSALSIALLLVSIRAPIGKLFVLGFAADPENPGKILKLLRRFWPVVYVVLLAIQVLTEAQTVLLGGVDSQAMQRSFGAFVIAPFLVAGLKIWSDHLSRDAEPRVRGRILGIFSLLEGAMIVGTGMFILYAWNIDPFATDLTGAHRILPGLVSAAIVAVIGISLWRTASALLILDTDAADGDDDGPPENEGGKGGSRIETVMPVLRAVTAAFIGTVTVLLALSSLGVQIAPLLAGAGILGLAIGFGAQKVVEDVISGVLYLVEDAFRKGEYIETAQGKGIVEAIMLRSVRLRHHLGPVFTIPFSAMGTIQNHSRDWVTVKLKFEVAPDQDLEKVRKLVKKVGQQLLDDPELEGQFLAPLKSQGAVALVGANYQIGVKFTSEPGKQFLIRRKALNAIQKAFADNGIEMAAPRVVVDTPEEAAAAAAKVATEGQATAAGGAPADQR